MILELLGLPEITGFSWCQFFQFLMLILRHLEVLCFRKKKQWKVRLIVAWFITNVGNQIKKLVKIPLEIWALLSGVLN